MGCMSPEPPSNVRDVFQHLLFSKIVPHPYLNMDLRPCLADGQWMNKTSLPNLISDIFMHFGAMMAMPALTVGDHQLLGNLSDYVATKVHADMLK